MNRFSARKRGFSFFFLIIMVFSLSSCSVSGTVQDTASPVPSVSAAEYEKYSGTFYDAFDTVTIITGFAANQETFDEIFSQAHDMFLHYHRIFDGYAAYDGVKNLYYMNKHASEGPVSVEPELLTLLSWLKEVQPTTNDTVNVAMGSVLSLWHDYREDGVEIPPMKRLQSAAAHTDFDDVILDSEAGTVYYADPFLKIDLGAVAKGYSVEILSQWLLTTELSSFILSAGGNVRCGGAPMDGRARWGVSIQDPSAQNTDMDPTSDYLDVLYLTDASVVTSGDYQRYYTVDGVRYHHIIDPDTLMPANYMHSVTIVTKDSGMADLLSTAVFLMPYEEGRTYVDSLNGVDAYWVLEDGTIAYTDGLKKLLRSEGASSRDE